MRRYRLVPVNAILFKVVFGASVAGGLALWGWLRPEISLPFMGQSITFSMRTPLLVMAGVLAINVLFSAWQEVRKWLYLA